MKSFGLTVDEIKDLIEHCNDPVDLEPAGVSSRPRTHADAKARVEPALEILRRLIAAGFSQKDIAYLAEVDPSSISHLLCDEARSVSVELLSRLETVIASKAYQERLNSVLRGLPISFLDACGASDQEISRADRTKIERRLQEDLALTLTDVMPRVAPIKRLGAVLASIGNADNDFYLLKIWLPEPKPTETAEQRAITRLRHKEHEVTHLLNRLRQKRSQLEETAKRVSQTLEVTSTGGDIA